MKIGDGKIDFIVCNGATLTGAVKVMSSAVMN